MDLKKAGVSAKMGAGQTSIGMRAGGGRHRYSAIAVWKSLGQHVLTEPSQVGLVHIGPLLDRFPRNVDDPTLEKIGKTRSHGFIVEVSVSTGHLRRLVAQIPLNDMLWHAVIDHPRGDRVPELVGLKTDRAAKRIPNVPLVGELVESAR